MKYILARYRKVYEGKTWYGKNISESLHLIKPEQRLRRVADSYNIVELVLHMIAWRKYVLTIVDKRIHREVPDAENFPTIVEYSDEQWLASIAVLARSQSDLISTLEGAELELQAESPKAGYSWSDIFEGLIHHDIYHIGQINLIRKYADATA